jgi:catechol 2,3-dioxygenase-like lactoylglutathione lyase family enzyme
MGHGARAASRRAFKIEADTRQGIGVEASFRPALKAHPAFLVTDLPQLIRELERAEYRCSSDEPLDGYERAYVHDPFGNRIELLEPLT